MTEIMEKLPENTFTLTGIEVSSFVRDLQVRFGISATAEQICIDALQHHFRVYGGFKEQPIEEGNVWMPYHNGSHPAYVMAVGLLLADDDNKSTETRDVIAVAGAYHDWYHHFTEAEKNERESAAVMTKDLASTELMFLSGRAETAILGTIVKRIGKDGIHQHAEDLSSDDAHYVADADLASLIAPNAAAWALRLQIEHEIADNRLVCKHEDVQRFYADQAEERMNEFLAVTRNLQLKHRFLSPAGQKLLQPLLMSKAAELDDVMARKHPLDYFGPRIKT